jgi:DeoR/GlpR family transcriptional regulator of sugar metabolism
MLASRRHELILRTLRTDGPAAVSILADRLGVSPATVRRDLGQLADAGRLTRVYGGAVATPDYDEPFADVASVRVAEKDAVAAQAATLINDGDAILLDIGTTAHRLARQLHHRPLTVMTSSLAVYEELVDDHAIELVMLGGTVRRSYRSLVGFLTEDALRQLRTDWAFLGTSGVRPDGTITDTTVVEVPVKRAMITSADRVVVLADASKFPGKGTARICGPDDLDVLITNEGADPDTLAALTDSGVDVQTAEPVATA